MRISVNCPSYKRPYVETLEYLPYCRVWVDESEHDAYVEANPEGSEIISCESGIQGNVCRIRNHIIKTELDRGMDAVCIIDDDMKGVFYYESEDDFAYAKHLVEADEFMEFLEKYTIMAQDLGAFLWGMNVNSDPQCYRQYSPFSTASYVGSPFQCFLKGNDCWYDERFSLKEDYDMTLQQLNKHRVALRLNKFFYDVKQAKQKGGCATYRNLEREKTQVEMLQKKWGSKIVKWDDSDRSHKMTKKKKHIDFNPVICPPIKGI